VPSEFRRDLVLFRFIRRLFPPYPIGSFSEPIRVGTKEKQYFQKVWYEKEKASGPGIEMKL
jgi:hypothetical protein